MTRIRTAWAWISPRVDTRGGTLVVMGLALAVFALSSIAWPVVEGRDYVTYMRFYAGMWSVHSVIPWEMLWRLPVAPAALGLPLDVGGPALARAWIALLFVATVTLWFRVALRYGAGAAVALAAALLLYPAFPALFHRYSSDAITGVMFALLALALTRAYGRPSTGRWVLVGVAVAATALTRPANQALVLIAVAPLVFPGPWRSRLTATAVCAVAACLPLVAWTFSNDVRYDDRALSRGGGAWLPFYRAYLTDGLIDPDNGPASRRLATLVARELVTREPYRSYGIGVDDVFGDPQTRYHEDLVSLSDRFLGWDTDYATLRDAAIEGIRRNPSSFAAGLARSFVSQLTEPLTLAPPANAPTPTPDAVVVVNGKVLPRPSEGQPIPAASRSYWLSRPDNGFDEVWTSPTEHHVVATRPELLRDLRRMERRVAGLRLPPGWSGWGDGARALNRVSEVYPSALVWLVVGLAAVLIRRPAGSSLALVLAAAALVVEAATLLSVPPVAEFGMPLFPAFVLLAACGLLGRRRRDAASPA